MNSHEFGPNPCSAIIVEEMELGLVHCMACAPLIKSPSHKVAFSHQLRSIAFRMNQPRVSPKLARPWKRCLDIHERLVVSKRVSADDGKTCYTSLCETPGPAEMMCSQCKMACYCSRGCQKLYVASQFLLRFPLIFAYILFVQGLENTQTRMLCKEIDRMTGTGACSSELIGL